MKFYFIQNKYFDDGSKASKKQFDNVEIKNISRVQNEFIKQAKVYLKHILNEIDNGAKLNEKFKEEIEKLAADIVHNFKQLNKE